LEFSQNLLLQKLIDNYTLFFSHYLRKAKADQSVKINIQIFVAVNMFFFKLTEKNFHCAHQFFFKILIFPTFRLQDIAFYHISLFKETKNQVSFFMKSF